MKGLLQTAAEVAVVYGVTDVGSCPLEQLSQLLPGRRRALLPTRGTVITLLLPYYTGDWPSRNVALYAIPDDYHRIAGGILERVASVLRTEYPQGSFAAFVDSSPIPEVEAAVRCGLGWRGKNGQLINKRYGSMTFIGEIVTDIETERTEKLPVKGGCGACRRCLDACPTGALGGEGMNSKSCRSAITQKKGELTPWEREQVRSGRLAWGCDICTVTCPYNSGLAATGIAGLGENLTPTLTEDRLEELLTAKSYGWRGRAVLQRNLAILDKATE